jgi:RNA polymerase sigma-70 factor, ECF subfamily
VKHHQPALAGDALDKVALTTMLDEVLIAMVAAHDRNAMHVLFVRHSARTYRFLLRLIGDATTAEDLLSEVFIEVWRSAGRFESRSKLSTWILAIARHKAASARRRRCCDQLDDNAEQLPEDRLDDPEAILRDCLQRLSPAHREVLDLIYYQAQSVAEVARIIGVPQNTVKTRAYYARKQIAQLMVARGIDRGAL